PSAASALRVHGKTWMGSLSIECWKSLRACLKGRAHLDVRLPKICRIATDIYQESGSVFSFTISSACRDIPTSRNIGYRNEKCGWCAAAHQFLNAERHSHLQKRPADRCLS